MINLAAVASVRNWPTIAEYGFSSLFFFILAAIVFLIPVSMIAAELATGWSKTGGIFEWVKEAFGHRTGFLAVWLLWAENVIYYPLLLSFIAGTIAYVVNPSLASDPIYTLFLIIALFWATTFANLLGMRISGWISSLGVVLGTIIPGSLIIGLGAFWFFTGGQSHISFRANSFFPDMTSLNHLVFFSGIIAALCGLEMSAVHARDVQNPQKNYPKAIFLSAIFILGLYILGVFAIALVIPRSQISLVAGSIQAFSFFVEAYKRNWLTPVMAALLAVGAFGTLSTWIAGPSMGLLGAAEQADLPPFFRRLNRHGMPAPLLMVQAIIVTGLSVLFLIMPTVSSAYWILNAMMTELYLIMYVLMFAAAIRLRYTQPNVPRAYKIPGGLVGIWAVGLLGFVGCLFTFVLGLLPPAQLPTGNTAYYITFLVLSLIVTCLIPSLILYFKKPSWSKP